MVETSSSWLCQQRSRWESSTFRHCMIAPVEHRQHEFLPASTNPCRVSADLGLNGLGFSGLPEKGFTREANSLIEKPVNPAQIPVVSVNGYFQEQTSLFPPRVDVQTSTFETPCPQEKRFLIFDQSGNETRLIFSSLCPWVLNLTTAHTKYPVQNLQAGPVTSSDAVHILTDGQQANKIKQAGVRATFCSEESGENETVDEGGEMREDTEEINALLYSDDDNFDADCDGEEEDSDEVSTGHSPLVIGRDCENQEEEDFDEVASYDRAPKRQKALDGGHNKLPLLHAKMMENQNVSYEDINGEDLICALDDGVGPTAAGSKRPRKDKIRDTLRVLESIIPGVKSKDPLVILDEAIIFLKRLKSDAETLPMEEPDSSSCCGPSNECPF